MGGLTATAERRVPVKEKRKIKKIKNSAVKLTASD